MDSLTSLIKTWTTSPVGVSNGTVAERLVAPRQFPDVTAFRAAIHRVMSLRQLAGSFGRELHSHRNIVNGYITPTTSLHDALQTLPQSEKRSLLQWLTRLGPFWEDIAEHGPDHWMDCGNEIVTETAVGEAAYCQFVGISRGLVSFIPSRWEHSPINVRVISDVVHEVAVPNYWQALELEAALRDAEPPISSWAHLESVSRTTFGRLTFSSDSFRYLDGQPFAPGPAALHSCAPGGFGPVDGFCGCLRAKDGTGKPAVPKPFHRR